VAQNIGNLGGNDNEIEKDKLLSREKVFRLMCYSMSLIYARCTSILVVDRGPYPNGLNKKV